MSRSIIRILCIAIVVVLVVHSECALRCAAAALDAALSAPQPVADPPCHKAANEHKSAPAGADTSHHRAEGCGQAAASESKGTLVLMSAPDSASLDVPGDLSLIP